MAENREQNTNEANRSPFTKPEGQEMNLHSQDVKKEEIKRGDPSLDSRQENELQKEPWKKNQQ